MWEFIKLFFLIFVVITIVRVCNLSEEERTEMFQDIIDKKKQLDKVLIADEPDNQELKNQQAEIDSLKEVLEKAIQRNQDDFSDISDTATIFSEEDTYNDVEY